ncbi:hypothetical protein [Mycobacterium palustre]|uniref:hypothetical protein n=1 Tax=Mycobacterium palustre TaxID=153971 RepID=UPI0026BBC045
MLKIHVGTAVPARARQGRAPAVGATLVALAATLSSAVLCAPPSTADPSPALQQAVVSARSGTSCPPLRYDPIVEHAAEIVNHSTDAYVSHTTRNSPADSPTGALPILKDLGSSAGKSWSLQGAGHDSDADAIKGAILEGTTQGAGVSLNVSPGVFKTLEDTGPAPLANCSYTDFGVSLLHNADTGLSLAVVVLAGK